MGFLALAIFMRLSLTKAAYAAMSSAAWQEIRGSAVERSAVFGSVDNLDDDSLKRAKRNIFPDLPRAIHVRRSDDVPSVHPRLFSTLGQIEPDRKPLFPIDPLIAKNLSIAGDAFHAADVQSQDSRCAFQ